MKNIHRFLLLMLMFLTFSCQDKKTAEKIEVCNEATERKLSVADLSLFGIRVSGAEKIKGKKCTISFSDSTEFNGVLASLNYLDTNEMKVALYSEEGTVNDFYKLIDLVQSEHGIPSYFYTGIYDKWIYDNVTISLKNTYLCLNEPAPLQNEHNAQCAIELKDIVFLEDCNVEEKDIDKALKIFYDKLNKGVEDYAMMKIHHEIDDDNLFTRGEVGIAWEFKNQTISIAISNNVVRMVYCDRGSDFRTAASEVLSAIESEV